MADSFWAPSRTSRLLAEGFVIVVSILLAFGIEAWWDGRQAGGGLDSPVELLEADIQQNLSEFARASQTQEVTLRTESYNEIIRAMARHGGLAAFVPQSLLDSLNFPTSTQQGDMAGLLADRDFEAAVTSHWATERNFAADFQRWIGRLEEIQEALGEL